jgi:5-(carboxyamino)imidazole ribonucleotide mutase
MGLDNLVVILMGSSSDQPHVDMVTAVLDALKVTYVVRVASAHKTPARLLEILRQYEQDSRSRVYITVAGRSNALSGMVDAQVSSPVIACPPASTAFGGADIYSSLRMPSGVAPMVVLEPANAGLAAAKILALSDPPLKSRVEQMQQANAQKVIQADDDQG